MNRPLSEWRRAWLARTMLRSSETIANKYRDLLAGVQVWTREPTVSDLDGFAAQVEAADGLR